MKASKKVLSNLDYPGTIELCQELVRIPSPIGKEKKVAEYIFNYLKSIGVKEVSLIEGDPGRPNVLAKIPGKTSEPGLLFYGHIDSEFELEGWTVEPYGGIIKDGKLFGRASKDMRAGIAAFLKVAEAILKSGDVPDKTLTMAFCVDEEVAGDKGIGYLVKEGYVNSKDSAYGIQGESYDFGDIMIADSGTFWLKITTSGIPQHTQLDSSRINGVNAVEKMVDIINALKKIKFDFAIHPLFPDMKPMIHCGTTIESRAGLHPNMIPDYCNATFDIRLLPGQNVDKVLQQIIDSIDSLNDPKLKYEIKTLKNRPPTEVQPDDPFVKLVARYMEQVTGKPAKVRGHEMTSDHSWIRSVGIKSMHAGPGNLMAHKPDEYIEIWQIEKALKLFALIASDFLYND